MQCTTTTRCNPASVAAEPSSKAPLFIKRLVQLLRDSSLRAIVSWAPDGHSFLIYAPEAFSSQVLPQYYGHTNVHVFDRQLHFHGFVKHQSLHSLLEYSHVHYRRGDTTAALKCEAGLHRPFDRERHAMVQEIEVCILSIQRYLDRDRRVANDILACLLDPEPSSSCCSSTSLSPTPTRRQQQPSAPPLKL